MHTVSYPPPPPNSFTSLRHIALDEAEDNGLLAAEVGEGEEKTVVVYMCVIFKTRVTVLHTLFTADSRCPNPRKGHEPEEKKLEEEEEEQISKNLELHRQQEKERAASRLNHKKRAAQAMQAAVHDGKRRAVTVVPLAAKERDRRTVEEVQLDIVKQKQRRILAETGLDSSDSDGSDN